MIALVETKDCRLSEGRNLAGDAANVVTFDARQGRCAARRRPRASSKNPCC